MATKEKGNDCYDKAAPKEAVFTLRAQDVTSDITVSFWIRAQLFVKKKMAEGSTLQEAIWALRDRLDVYFPLNATTDPKLLEALNCSDNMNEWPDRKVAD